MLMGLYAPALGSYALPDTPSRMSSQSAIALLSSVATGMMALTGIVFALVFVAVQFGSTTYGPRLARELGREQGLTHSLGVFTGTFVYASLAIRAVDISGATGLHAVVVWLAFAWLLASVIAVVALPARVATLSVANVLALLGRRGSDAVLRVYPDAYATGVDTSSELESKDRAENAVTQTIVYTGPSRYLVTVNASALERLARGSHATIHVPRAIGDAVLPGDTLAIVRGGEHPLPERRIRRALSMARARAIERDPAYAIRLLVDIAVRALSPGINDPTSAVTALDEIELLLREIGRTRLTTGRIEDSSRNVRVVLAVATWADIVSLALAEILHYGRDSIQVQRRLGALLRDLPRSLPAVRHRALERFAARRQVLLREAFPAAEDRDYAELPDRQGIGHASDEPLAHHSPREPSGSRPPS